MGGDKKRKYSISISVSYDIILLLKSSVNVYSRENRVGRNTCENGPVEQQAKL